MDKAPKIPLDNLIVTSVKSPAVVTGQTARVAEKRENPFNHIPPDKDIKLTEIILFILALPAVVILAVIAAFIISKS